MSRPTDQVSVIWLYPGHLDRALDAATWLDTTNELRKAGWDVTLVAAGSSGVHTIRGTEVYCIPMPNIYFLRQLVFHLGFYPLFFRLHRKADVILFEQMSALWLLPVRWLRSLAWKRRPLLVIDIRSLHMPDPEKQGLKSWLRGKFQDFVARTANRWVDGYLTITPRMAEVMHISPKQLWGVWPSGVKLDLFNAQKRMRFWPSNDDPLRLIYIGTLSFERNLMALCQAVVQANADGMCFELWLVGDGDQRADLERFSSGTQGCVLVKPSIPHEQVPQLLSQMHVGVLPFPDETKFQVSSPIKLFEYMAAGMPILATRVVCHTDVVGDGTYVFWADESDVDGLLVALKQAWQRRAELPEMSAQAASAAKAWTWHQSALKLKRALEFGLEGSRP